MGEPREKSHPNRFHRVCRRLSVFFSGNAFLGRKEKPVFSAGASNLRSSLRRLGASNLLQTLRRSSIAARDPVSLQRIAQFALLRTSFAPGASPPRRSARARTDRKKPMDDLGAMNYSLTLLEQEECESVCARFLIDDFATVPAAQLAPVSYTHLTLPTKA